MTDPTALRVERTFYAPAQDVFDALVNPDVMRRWWHAGEDWETPHAEADPRLGGRFRVVMRRPDEEEYAGSGHGQHMELPRPERARSPGGVAGLARGLPAGAAYTWWRLHDEY